MLLFSIAGKGRGQQTQDRQIEQLRAKLADKNDVIAELMQAGVRAKEDPGPRRKQVLDLPPVHAVVTEHQIHTLTCPRCGVSNCGERPEPVPRGWFGPQVVATVMMLSKRSRVGVRHLFRLEIACKF